jgi:hypothetical protein
MWIGIFGFFLMSILISKKYKAGIVIGVVSPPAREPPLCPAIEHFTKLLSNLCENSALESRLCAPWRSLWYHAHNVSSFEACPMGNCLLGEGELAGHTSFLKKENWKKLTLFALNAPLLALIPHLLAMIPPLS